MVLNVNSIFFFIFFFVSFYIILTTIIIDDKCFMDLAEALYNVGCTLNPVIHGAFSFQTIYPHIFI